MPTLKKLHQLKFLYTQQAIGFCYCDEIHAEPPIVQTYARSEDLDKLRTQVLQCHLCELSKTRKQIVFGEGNPHAALLFVGEGPRESEDATGRPFVGRAGELLTKMIENVLGLGRSDVYIANIVKCRPPNNREPKEEEVAHCKPYLMEQIRLIAPKLIVALGKTSYQNLTGDFNTPISKIRGEVLPFGGALLLPTFHPSFLLRNPSAKKEAYQDMLKVKSLL